MQASSPSTAARSNAITPIDREAAAGKAPGGMVNNESFLYRELEPYRAVDEEPKTSMINRSVPVDDSSNSLGVAFLSIASGCSDVIAFLLLGHVFASAMTGNLALVGITLSDGNLIAASQPASALFGFVAGAACGSAISRPAASPGRHAMIARILLLSESCCLVAFAIVWEATGHARGGAAHYILILLCSFGMGIQGILAKFIKAPGVNTIVFTSTLVAIVSSLTETLLKRADAPAINPATRRQIAIFGAYGAGAVLAGLLYWMDFPYLVWLPAIAVVMAFGLYEVEP